MKAAQMASMPPSGPRKSHVATAPSTPRLIASAVFKDISPPLLVGERVDVPRRCRRSTGSIERKPIFTPRRFGFRLNHSRSGAKIEHSFHNFAQIQNSQVRVNSGLVGGLRQIVDVFDAAVFYFHNGRIFTFGTAPGIHGISLAGRLLLDDRGP